MEFVAEVEFVAEMDVELMQVELELVPTDVEFVFGPPLSNGRGGTAFLGWTWTRVPYTYPRLLTSKNMTPIDAKKPFICITPILVFNPHPPCYTPCGAYQ